ncbi:hypothetical protein KGF54_000254 [Candida jiufengensis]|uniref:uncharacterized protein n=1 Tax=Candida jiufengensis TaxID=497108 RepID=UPI002224B630|nr:uncharacterized protein KGF54_000254 [Candida jiufengensis]KAI5957326.1 hypothetical protein KGF54_000254 [Candida jiufengensis]
MDYHNILQKISIGSFRKEKDTKGALIAELDPGHGCQINVSMYSFDNYEILTKAYELYQHAIAHERWGDGVYLTEFIYHNGVITNTSLHRDITKILTERANNDTSMIKLWKETTTNKNLENYFASLLEKVIKDNIRSTITICSDANYEYFHSTFDKRAKKIKQCPINSLISDADRKQIKKLKTYVLCFGSECLSWNIGSRNLKSSEKFINSNLLYRSVIA